MESHVHSKTIYTVETKKEFFLIHNKFILMCRY